MPAPDASDPSTVVGRRVRLPGHFDDQVEIEAVRRLGTSYGLRVRRPNGQLEEAVLSADEFAGLASASTAPAAMAATVDPEQLRLLVESARIRLAYAYDRRFAVSPSARVSRDGWASA